MPFAHKVVMRTALYWEPLEDGKVKCKLCPLNCIINPEKRGSCKVRINIDGKLYTLNYGKVSSIALDPIEKKPLFHFWPGSCAFSIGTVGCNMHCKHCQNWEISQADESFPYLQDATPESIVRLARHYECESIAYTYNEPTIWYEFVLDTAKLAKKEGLNNILVTNGYINEEPFRELAKYIDAMNIDIKAFNDKFYMKISSVPSGEPSRRTAVIAKKEFGNLKPGVENSVCLSAEDLLNTVLSVINSTKARGAYVKIFGKDMEDNYLLEMLVDGSRILAIECSYVQAKKKVVGEEAIKKLAELVELPLIVSVYPLDDNQFRLILANNLEVYSQTPAVPLSSVFKKGATRTIESAIEEAKEEKEEEIQKIMKKTEEIVTEEKKKKEEKKRSSNRNTKRKQN